MKTLEDLCKEISTSEELKKAFAQAAKDNKVADFLKAQGCDATEDEFKAFLTEKAKDDKALSEGDLENVAGGSELNLSEGCISEGCMICSSGGRDVQPSVLEVLCR